MPCIQQRYRCYQGDKVARNNPARGCLLPSPAVLSSFCFICGTFEARSFINEAQAPWVNQQHDRVSVSSPPASSQRRASIYASSNASRDIAPHRGQGLLWCVHVGQHTAPTETDRQYPLQRISMRLHVLKTAALSRVNLVMNVPCTQPGVQTCIPKALFIATICQLRVISLTTVVFICSLVVTPCHSQ